MEIYYIVYDVVYNVVYDIVYDITRFIQPAARLLHQPTLLPSCVPSDCASKLQLLSALILERAPAASLLHPTFKGKDDVVYDIVYDMLLS
jgi:hypothetical protein